MSSVTSGALSGAINGGGNVQQVVAIAAFKSALQSQASILQLFEGATVPPPASSGRGQNLDIAV